MSDTVAEFSEIVKRITDCLSLPCVCDDSSEESLEQSLTNCTPCHVDGLLTEILDFARDQMNYVEGMADRHPKKKILFVPNKKKSNVVRFHPAGRELQPNAIWKP